MKFAGWDHNKCCALKRDAKMELVSVRFAFPSAKKQSNTKEETDPNISHNLEKDRHCVCQGDTCIINAVPCLLVVKTQLPGGKHGWHRYAVTGKSLLTGSRHQGFFYVTEGVEVPLVKTEECNGQYKVASLKDCWKVQHKMVLQPPNNQQFYAMECVYKSEAKILTENWQLSMNPTIPNTFLSAALSFLRAQEKERFYYFLCAAQKQDICSHPEALSPVLDFLCGPKRETCSKLTCF